MSSKVLNLLKYVRFIPNTPLSKVRPHSLMLLYKYNILNVNNSWNNYEEGKL